MPASVIFDWTPARQLQYAHEHAGFYSLFQTRSVRLSVCCSNYARSTLKTRYSELAQECFQFVVKEIDWRVMRAYIALEDVGHCKDNESTKRQNDPVVDWYLDRDGWEKRNRGAKGSGNRQGKTKCGKCVDDRRYAPHCVCKIIAYFSLSDRQFQDSRFNFWVCIWYQFITHRRCEYRQGM